VESRQGQSGFILLHVIEISVENTIVLSSLVEKAFSFFIDISPLFYYLCFPLTKNKPKNAVYLTILSTSSSNLIRVFILLM
jgi:hypothetical protein